MDFLGQLASDSYKLLFPQEEGQDLSAFCAAVSQDAGSTVEEIKGLLLSANSKPTYEECKTALIAHFSFGAMTQPLAEGPPPQIERVLTPEKTEEVDPLAERFLALATDGRLSLKPAMDFFQEWQREHSSTLTALEISKFRELLLFSEKRIIRSPNRSPSLHRRHQSQPPQLEAVVTLDEFRDALKKWEANRAASQSVADKLRASIQEYREAIALLGDNQPQVKAIEGIIATLEKQLQAFERPPEQDETLEKQLQSWQAKSLQTIFSFYCKQQSIVGPKPTFEEITSSLTHWNLGKFVKFAIDFDIAGKPTDTQKMSKDELKTVFLASCSGHRKMSYDQFLEALDKIAERNYNSTYDSLHGTNVATKPLKDKRALLYLELGLENPKQVTERMRRFGPAISQEKAGYRLPEDDLARRYRTRLKASQRPELQEWKARKATQSSGATALRSSIDSSKFSYVPSDAIAVRRQAALNYSELYQQRHNAVSVTWQALSHMHYSDINVGDNIGELIGVGGAEKYEDEDLLDKQYGLGKFSQGEPSAPQSAVSVPTKPQDAEKLRKMEGLMRLHEQRVTRGLRVLKRTSASKSVNNSVSNKM